MSKKVAYFTNIAPHYRESLWLKFIEDKDVEFHFYYGFLPNQSIKPINFDTKKWTKYQHQLHLLKNIIVKDRLLFQRKIFREVLFKNWDVIILLGHASIISNWLIILIAKIRGIKIIIWGHGIYGNEGKLKKNITRQFLNFADVVLLYGNWAKGILVDNGINKNKIEIIYNSINYKLIKEKRDKNISSDYYKRFFFNERPTIVYIGRLTKYKKLDKLIRALKELKDSGKIYNLMIVGNGDERFNLQKLATKLRINHVFFGACYSEEQISYLLSNADLCVSPGNVGLTAVHAMSYGVPVCTHDYFSYQGPEFEIIKSQVTGFFYNKNENNLGEAIHNWFENSPNRSIIRENCYNIIDTYYNPNYQYKVMKKALNLALN